MIDSIVNTPEVHTDYNLQAKRKWFQSPQPSQTNSNQDVYVTNDPKQNLKNGLKNGDVVYTEPTTILWGAITLRDGFYTYTCNGKESIGDIKKKFGIPDNVIFRLNRIRDDNYIPEKGKEIAFNYIQ